MDLLAVGAVNQRFVLLRSKEVIMKTGILLVVSVLCLALFAIPEAEGWWYSGPDIDQRFAGSTATVEVDTDEGTGEVTTTTVQNLYTKGKPGTGHLDVTTVYASPVFDPARCPAQYPLSLEIISVAAVATFRDLSTVTMQGAAGNFACTDGSVFVADSIVGPVTGGTGRMQGASGTWEATDVFAPTPAFTGKITAEFD